MPGTELRRKPVGRNADPPVFDDRQGGFYILWYGLRSGSCPETRKKTPPFEVNPMEDTPMKRLFWFLAALAAAVALGSSAAAGGPPAVGGRMPEFTLPVPEDPQHREYLGLQAGDVVMTLGGEAVVATSEYWYLRWRDVKADSYVYPYRETNRQLYILRKEPDGWRVFENLRPPPRSSVPHRWRQRR